MQAAANASAAAPLTDYSAAYNLSSTLTSLSSSQLVGKYSGMASTTVSAGNIDMASSRTEGEGVVLRMDPRHRIRGPLLYRAAESKALWREISAPTLFVDGARSPFPEAVDAEERAARRACFARHETVTIADAGHMLHFDAPQATAETVESWLHAQGWPAPETAAAIG